MLQSMTGYAATMITIVIDQENRVHVALSLKSLNSKFFEVTAKLSPIFAPFETEIIRLLKEKLMRGHIYMTVSLSDINAFKTEVEPSLSSIKGYLDAITMIKKTFGITQDVSISDILRLPNIFNLKESSLTENAKEQFFNAVDKLILDLIEERKREGVSLQKDLEQRIEQMQQNIDQIAQLFEQDSERKKQEIAKKLQEITPQDEEFAALQRQALYVTLDKMDIHEEIVRFKTHLLNLRTMLAITTDLEKGKQLDFTLQEVGREINTLLAKTTNPVISALALTIKVELEKAREQAQNIV